MNADKCSACRGQCCYGALVRLSWDDVRRVGRSQHLDFASFAQMVVDEGRTSQEFALAFGLGPHAEPHLLALRHSSRVANACAFLVLVAGQPCGIYEDRPAVCRVYPMRRSGAGIAVRDDVICRPHDWDRARFDPAPYVDAIGLQHCEWRTFERTVAVWNRTLAGAAEQRPTRLLRISTQRTRGSIGRVRPLARATIAGSSIRGTTTGRRARSLERRFSKPSNTRPSTL